MPPIAVAVSVPSGMLLRGFFRSPDSPTPAVMPVNAGKQIANTTKNGSAPATVRVSGSVDSAFGSALPAKNITIAMPITAPTIASALIPRSAPLNSMTTSISSVAGTLTMRGSNSIPRYCGAR